MYRVIHSVTLLVAVASTVCGEDLPLVFNGEDFAGWKIPKNNIWWTANDGVLEVRSGPKQKGSNIFTKKEYSNFVMQFDFKMGEGTIDTGIFIRNNDDQIQIGQSGSLKRDMTCSPYVPGKGYPVEAQGVADLLKLDDWNSMTIMAIGSNYVVWLNGKQVLNYTSEIASEKGPIGIQLHSRKEMSVDYRNIRIGNLK